MSNRSAESVSHCVTYLLASLSFCLVRNVLHVGFVDLNCFVKPSGQDQQIVWLAERCTRHANRVGANPRVAACSLVGVST